MYIVSKGGASINAGDREPVIESVSLQGDRANNQDRAEVFRHQDRVLLVLADGMGGHADGAAAAQCVLDAAAELLGTQPHLPPAPLMQRIALTAHQAIATLRPDASDREQPRTTVVMCHLQGRNAVFAHAGDSRGYLIREGQVAYRTRDHSVVEMMVRRGELSEDEALAHPLRNQVSRCVGGLGKPPVLDLTPCPPLRNGDTLLLASDGFWEPLTAAQLCADTPLEALAARATAVHIGRADNCTALRLRLGHV